MFWEKDFSSTQITVLSTYNHLFGKLNNAYLLKFSVVQKSHQYNLQKQNNTYNRQVVTECVVYAVYRMYANAKIFLTHKQYIVHITQVRNKIS